MWTIEHMIIVKDGDNTGTVSVKLVDEEGSSIFLNKIGIDLSSGANAIGIAKVSGTPVISGGAVDEMKTMILEVFQESLSDKGPGIYKIDENGVESI